MVIRRALLLLSLPAFLACAPRPATAPQPDSAERADDLAPIPYTADELQKASTKGRRIEYRLEVAGKPAARRVMEFTASDAAGAELATSVLDEAGATVEGPKVTHATWAELRKHGAFPRAAVTITAATTTVPAGTFECSVYRVTKGSGPDAEISTFHFAKTLPGPPVLFFSEKAGQRVMTSTMIANQPGG